MTAPAAEPLTQRWVNGGMFGTATFDASGAYRYDLTRAWEPAGRTVAFCMLNPSTADHRIVDPTVGRCVGFARAWGYGRLIVRNAFAFKSTDPRGLKLAIDPVGVDNDEWLRRLIADAELVVVAWGAGGTLYRRDLQVRRILAAHPDVRCLGVTKDGQPRHPLYLRHSLRPIRLGTAQRKGRT